MPAFTFNDGNGAAVKVQQQPSQTLRLFLQSGETSANVATAQWQTEDRRVLPVEIRIRLTAHSPVAAAFPAYRDPVLGYSLDLSLGAGALEAPQGSGADANAYAVPARGAVVRVLARDALVHVRYDGHFRDPQYAPDDRRFEWIDVLVSFMPCDELTIAQPPTAAYSRYFSNLQYQPFPPEAREFRLVDQTGQPFADGYSRDVFFKTAIGNIFRDKTNHDQTFDRGVFAEWTPISPRFAGWGIGGGAGNWDVPGFGGPIPELPADERNDYCIALYR